MAKTDASKWKREKDTVSLMIALYCKKQHHTRRQLCPECAALRDYACLPPDTSPTK